MKIKTKTKSQNSAFSLVLFAIAKIGAREIRLPNIREIKYARKLVRIRYLEIKKHLKILVW